MKKFWRNLIIGAAMMTASFAFGISSVFFNSSKPVEVSADDSGTIYVAIKPTDIGSYNIRANLNIGDNDTFWQFKMSPTKYTYNNGTHYILEASVNTKYGGVDAMQIQRYNGDTWVDQKVPYSSWTSSSTFYGKMYVYDTGSWVSYSADTVKTASVYIDFFDWGTTRVYSFETIGGYTLETRGAYSNSSTDVTIVDNNLKFNGGMLQKVDIEYAVLANTKFIYHTKDDSNKSSNQTLIDGAYYWHNGTAWTHDSGDYAAAAAYVYDFNVARLAVPASSKVKQYSICGLNAKTWVDRFNNTLSVTAQGYVKAATIWTYKDKESTGADTIVTFTEILKTLNSRYALYSSANLIGNEEDSASIVTIVAIFILSAVGITTFFVFQKKKRLINK